MFSIIGDFFKSKALELGFEPFSITLIGLTFAGEVGELRCTAWMLCVTG